MNKIELQQRFWSKVNIPQDSSNPKICWDWVAGKRKKGYGVFSINGKMFDAHRAAWIIQYGTLRSQDFILHTCDRPSCVRPGHLYKGNHIQNMKDYALRGSPYRVLTEELVKLARLKYEKGERFIDIAKDLGVDRRLIRKPILRKTWTWLE